tara:strand:+ start:3224 stop:3703 length:480 start_codon:yes stop_codon:yes gene_type:complete
MKKQKNFLILHNIRSILNVGAIFRTAECAGISKIYLTGYTPTPIDRFKRERSDFHKAALGTQKIIDWEYNKSVSRVLSCLQKEGIKLVAIEQDKGAMDYKKYKESGSTAFILGNEVRGLSKQILQKVDAILEIPLMGKKESLNVSVAAGVVLFRVLDKI